MGIVRAMSALAQMNQKDGFDCPSCAWPDPEIAFEGGGILRERCQSLSR